MRTYETRTVEETRKVLVKRTCDICGREAVDDTRWKCDTQWQHNETTLRVTVHQTDGTNYPEGGWGTEFIVDMCPQCFKDKLLPWIKSQGGDVQEQDWGW